MKIRLLKPWRNQLPGHVFDAVTNGAAQVLVQRKIAEYLDESVQRAPVDRMIRPARGKKSAA